MFDDFVCPICEKVFKTRGYLEAHQRKGICNRDHQCEHCERKFSRKHNLLRHREICTSENPYFDDLPDETIPRKKIIYRKKDPNSTTGPIVPPGTWGSKPSAPAQSPECHVATGRAGQSEAPIAFGPLGSELESGLSPALQKALENQRAEFKELLNAKLGTLVPYGTAKKNGEDGEEGDENETTKEPKIDIVCLAKGDYIKKLIELHDGDEEKAMNYIKNVGIATDFLEGDFRMIKRIYFDGKKKSQFPIRIKDFKRNKLEYLEENGEWILDIRGEIVGKRLCENIVSTLLIANTQFNEVIIAEKDEDRKELLLDLFQINKTQAHIMKLLERKTQGKLSKRVAEFINFCTEVHAETGSLDNVKKAYE